MIPILALAAAVVSYAMFTSSREYRHLDPAMSSRMKGGAIIAAIVAVAAFAGAVG